MGARLRDHDRGWARIRKAFGKMATSRKGPVAQVGIQGDSSREEGGETNAMIAAVHEFGSPTRSIPQRSFLRSTFDEHQRAYQRELDGIARRALDGAKLTGELLLLGEQYRSDVLDKINEGIPPALQDATIERKKGETTPLIDTGQLRNAIRVVVVEGTG